MIDKAQAELIAATWIYQDRPVGVAREFGVHEFALGYVYWLILPPGLAEDVGAGRIVVDRENGELTHWPSVPPESVAELYQRHRAENPVAPLTWDPLVQARHDRVRTAFPSRVAHLRLADGRLRMGHSMKGDGTPSPHPIVGDFLAELPARLRERGYDRCAEVAAISDELYAEDARRTASSRDALTAQSVRAEFLRGADIIAYLVREPGDPAAGQSAPPCLSCHALLRHCGFTLQPPGGDERGVLGSAETRLRPRSPGDPS